MPSIFTLLLVIILLLIIGGFAMYAVGRLGFPVPWMSGALQALVGLIFVILMVGVLMGSIPVPGLGIR